MLEQGPNVLSPEYYDRLHALEQGHGWFRGMRALAGALLDPRVPGDGRLRILDVGCGTGGMMTWLRRYRGAAVVGIDVTMDALKFCRERGQDGLALASALDLPFRAGSFDLVVCTDVIQHLPDPPGDGAALAEVARVLRPGGYLYLRTNSTFGMGNAAGARPSDYRRYARRDLNRRVRAGGFAVLQSTYANSLPSLLSVARNRLRRRWAPVPTRDLGLRVQLRPPSRRWVDHLLFALLSGEAWYVRTLGRALPFGHSLVVLAQKPGANEEAPAPPILGGLTNVDRPCRNVDLAADRGRDQQEPSREPGVLAAKGDRSTSGPPELGARGPASRPSGE